MSGPKPIAPEIPLEAALQAGGHHQIIVTDWNSKDGDIHDPECWCFKKKRPN